MKPLKAHILIAVASERHGKDWREKGATELREMLEAANTQ